MEAIIQYLKKVDSNAIKDAIEAYNCFEPYKKDVENYARASAFVPENCEDEVIEMLSSLRRRLMFIVKKIMERERKIILMQNRMPLQQRMQNYITVP